MALTNTTLPAVAEAGEIIKTAVYDNLNALLANDEALDERLVTCQKNAETVYSEVKGE